MISAGASKLDTILTQLVQAAVKAPSGDDLQPWRIVVDEDARKIALFLDESRDPSPMNAGQRMSRMAIGAAIENVLRVARSAGLEPELELPSTLEPLAVVRISGDSSEDAVADTLISERVTNRRMYDGHSLPLRVQDALRAHVAGTESIQVHWVFDPGTIKEMAELIGQADGLMFSVPTIRQAFLENVRFDLPANTEVSEGLSIGSLELAFGDRVALRLMPWLPDWLLRVAGAERKFAASASRLVASASGLCLIDQPDLDPSSDVRAGQIMQRAWLALTSQNLAGQPMMSLVVLDNMRSQGCLPREIDASRITALLEPLRKCVPEIAGRSPAFVFRFGSAPPPTVRTSRLPFEANVTEGNLN